MIERSRARTQQAIKEQIGEYIALHQRMAAVIRAQDNKEWLARALKQFG